MTVLEALSHVRKNLMQIETKGESSVYLVDSLRMLAQIEATLTPPDKEPESGNDEEKEVEE